MAMTGLRLACFVYTQYKMACTCILHRWHACNMVLFCCCWPFWAGGGYFGPTALPRRIYIYACVVSVSYELRIVDRIWVSIATQIQIHTWFVGRKWERGYAGKYRSVAYLSNIHCVCMNLIYFAQHYLAQI